MYDLIHHLIKHFVSSVSRYELHVLILEAREWYIIMKYIPVGSTNCGVLEILFIRRRFCNNKIDMNLDVMLAKIFVYIFGFIGRGDM